MRRYSNWGDEECYSGQWRHSLCVFGIGDLAPTIKNVAALFVNKMMPEYDFDAILCWHEEMRRKYYEEREQPKIAVHQVMNELNNNL